ncbi:MAG: DeoR family transcriptional regulator, partial [Bacillota bacterium]
MSVARRHEILLNTLMAARGPVTIRQLAALVKTSPRTVRYDLDDLEPWLKARELKLVRRPRRGVWLEGDARTVPPPALPGTGPGPSPTRDTFIPAPERQALVMARLLARSGTESIRGLSDLVGVTRTTVYRELHQLAGQMDRRSLRLLRTRNGVRAEGLEVNQRRALYELLQQWVLDVDLKEGAGETSALRGGASLGLRLMRELTDRPPADLRALVVEAAGAVGYPLTPGQVVGLLF